MTRFWLALGLCVPGLLISGCSTTLTLPQGPDIYSLSLRPSAPTLLVARPVDQRADKRRVGTIESLRLNMKDDPSELVAKEVVSALHERGFNAMIGLVSSEDPAVISQATSQTQARGVLGLAIESLSVKSFDAFLDPPTASVTLRATLYDRRGAVVGTTTVTGSVRHRLGLLIEKAAAQLLGEAVHDAAQQLIAQEPLASLLKRLQPSDGRSEPATDTQGQRGEASAPGGSPRRLLPGAAAVSGLFVPAAGFESSVPSPPREPQPIASFLFDFQPATAEHYPPTDVTEVKRYKTVSHSPGRPDNINDEGPPSRPYVVVGKLHFPLAWHFVEDVPWCPAESRLIATRVRAVGGDAVLNCEVFEGARGILKMNTGESATVSYREITLEVIRYTDR